jgi:hypothetical protein
MNSRRLISALQRFAGKPIAIWEVLELVLMAGYDAVDGSSTGATSAIDVSAG